MSVLTDAWQTLVPPAGDRHGPLSPLLLVLTVVTGLVDAFSYLVLGHVFVANMTGNVVFLAFAWPGPRASRSAPRWPPWAPSSSVPSAVGSWHPQPAGRRTQARPPAR